MIDAFQCTEDGPERHPEHPLPGVGTMIVIDPEDLMDPQGLTGRSVTLTRPDGTCVRIRVDLAVAPAGALGLFFQGRVPAEFPRGSTIEWDVAC